MKQKKNDLVTLKILKRRGHKNHFLGSLIRYYEQSGDKEAKESKATQDRYIYQRSSSLHRIKK